MAELPEELLTVIKKRWAESKKTKEKRTFTADVKFATAINVATTFRHVTIVELRGDTFYKWINQEKQAKVKKYEGGGKEGDGSSSEEHKH